MPSTYTTNLGIEKIATGEQSGTWGTTTNTNFDLIDTAVNGIVSITLASAGTSGSPNDLPITDGTASNGRNKFIEFVDGGDLGATAYVQLTPNDAEKIVHIRNSLSGSRSIIVFQGTYNASNDFEIPNGADVTLKFDGAGTGATVTDVNVDLTVTGATIATADINGGTIDGTTIGGSSAAAGTFTTFTSTGIDDNAASTAITIDSSQDVTFTSDAKFPDNGKAIFGAGSDLQIYHNGSHSIIADAGTGHLKLLAADLRINNAADTETFIAAYENSKVDIYYDNSVKLSTTATGIDVTGDVNSDSVTTGTFTSTGIDDNATSTAITIDSSENVGIGTISPGRKLTVSRDAGSSIVGSFVTANTGEGVITFSNSTTTSDTFVRIGCAGDDMLMYAGNAERMRIDSSGNVGFGVTPDAWASPNFTALQIGVGGSIAGRGAVGTGDQIYVSANAYYDGTSWEYIESNYATNYYQDNGTHVWRYAASGTAGTAISFSEAMRIDSSGQVGIGIAPYATRKLTVFGTGAGEATVMIEGEGGADPCINFLANNTQHWTLGIDDSDADKFKLSEHSALGTNDYLVVDVSGNVGIGTTSPDSILHLSGSSTSKIIIEDSASPRGNYIGINSSDNLVIAADEDNLGSSSTIQLRVDATERMRIDASGNVGIGTTSPSTYSNAPELVIDTGTSGGITVKSGTAGYGAVFFADGTTGNEQYRGSIQYNHDFSGVTDALLFGTAGAERMRIDSSGNVGIGSPGKTLTALSDGTNSGPVLAIGNTDTALGSNDTIGSLTFLSDDNSYDATYTDGIAVQISAVSEHSTGNRYGLAFYTGNASGSPTRGERLRIDSVGNVGIGTNNVSFASGYTTVNINGSTGGQIHFSDDDVKVADFTANTGDLFIQSAGVTSFRTGGFGSGDEAMRIDSSGNVLVGTTTYSSANEGVLLGAGGIIYATNTSGFAASLNRKTTDGDLLRFEKDGATVGTIGTYFGDLYIASPSSTDAGIGFGGSKISPTTTTGSLRDAAIDLGQSAGRFKDLYLSAAVRWYASGVQKAYMQYDGTDVVHYGASGVGHQFYSGGNRSVDIDSSGNLLVGTTSATVSTEGFRVLPSGSSGAMQTEIFNDSGGTALAVGRGGSDGACVIFKRGSTTVGSISVTGSATSYNPSSDARLKENIRDYDNALADVMKLKPRKYSWKADGAEDNGFIAQELMETPEFANRVNPIDDDSDDPMYGVDYMKFVAVLTGAIQEQQVMIEELKAEVAALKGA